MTHRIILYIGLSLLIVHEMDAIQKKEWRMFPLLSKLKPETGYTLFSVLHIPLFVFIFWALFDLNRGLHNTIIMLLNVFLMIHFSLHLICVRHPQNEFRSTYSWSIIGGLFLIGAIGILV